MVSDILDGVCLTLAQTDRPLSVRRILRIARETGAIAEETTLVTLKDVLQDGESQGRVRQSRRGVYTLPREADGLESSDGQPPSSVDESLSDGSLSGSDDLSASGDDIRRDDGRGRRRRRSRRQRLEDGPPIAPSNVEAAAALSVRSKDRAVLREKVWGRILARAETIVDPGSAKVRSKDAESKGPGGEQGHEVKPSALLPSPSVETTDAVSATTDESADSSPRRALRDRLRARRQERSTSPVPATVTAEVEVAAPSEVTTPEQGALEKADDNSEVPSARARLRSRRRNRRIRTSADEILESHEVSEPGEPYLERRAEKTSVSQDRRRSSLADVVTTNEQAALALDALRREGQPMTYEALVDRLGTGPAGLKAAILAENNRRSRAGFRPPFAVDHNGEVGLTEWGMSTRYLSLENQIVSAVGEQREIVRRALLEAVSELSADAFAQLLVVLLERLGYTTVTTVHRQAGNVAVTAQRKTTTGDETVAVVARQGWAAISEDVVEILRESLAHFSAHSGLLLTVGTYDKSAIDAAGQSGVPTVRLLDGAGFARLLYDNGIGLTSHQLELSYVDAAFLASLAQG